MKHAFSHYGRHSNIALATLVINPQCEMISLSLPPGTLKWLVSATEVLLRIRCLV